MLASEDGEPSIIRVVMAEHKTAIRRSVAAIFSVEPNVSVVAEATDGVEALRLARTWRPDIVLMGLPLPRSDGCGTIKRIVTECPETQVIVLTGFENDELVFDAISSGADAYLRTDARPDEILSAIRAVMRHESYLAPDIAHKVLLEFRRIRPVSDELSCESLTKRERCILDLVMRGLSNKEIAAIIFLAEGTVKNYVSRIMEKINVHTRTELAITGLRHPKLVKP